MCTAIKEVTIEELQNILGYEVKVVKEHKKNPLGSKSVGETFEINGTEFIVLGIDGNKVIAITKDFILEREQFDSDTNNYKNSSLRKKIKKFGESIANCVGKNSLYKLSLDLTSDDGLDDYGIVEDDYAGLLTCDMYRKYSRVIEKFPVDYWWWTATPHSTPHRGVKYTVRFVSDVGRLSYAGCSYGNGVRPFLIFDSNILVS